MDRATFYAKLAELMELDGSLKGSDVLERLNAWDSLAVLAFIAMADTDYHCAVSAQEIAQCTIVDDLADLIATHGGHEESA